MFDYFISHYGYLIVYTVLCAFFGTVGYALKRASTIFLDTKIKREIAHDVVKFVYQTCQKYTGPEKLKTALEKAEELLKAKGVPFDATEMEVIIESALVEFYQAVDMLPYVAKTLAEKVE